MAPHAIIKFASVASVVLAVIDDAIDEENYDEVIQGDGPGHRFEDLTKVAEKFIIII